MPRAKTGTLGDYKVLALRLAIAGLASMVLSGCYYFDFLLGDIGYPQEWPQREQRWPSPCIDLSGTYRDSADAATYNHDGKPKAPQKLSGIGIFAFFTAAERQKTGPNGVFEDPDISHFQIAGPRDGRLRVTLWAGKKIVLEKDFVQPTDMECGSSSLRVRHVSPREIRWISVSKNVAGGLIVESYDWECMFPLIIGCAKFGGWYQWPRMAEMSPNPGVQSDAMKRAADPKRWAS